MKLKKVVVSLAGLALLGVGTIAFSSNSVSAAETDEDMQNVGGRMTVFFVCIITLACYS